MPKELRISIDLAIPLSDAPLSMAEAIMRHEGEVVDFSKRLKEAGARVEHSTQVVTPRPREKKPAEPGPLLRAMGVTDEAPPATTDAAPEPTPTDKDPLDIPNFLRRTPTA